MVSSEFQNSAVFIDRDGVINKAIVSEGKPYAPRNSAEFELIKGVPEQLNRLKANGFLIIVITNQPDIGHGLISANEIKLMHAELQEKVLVDEIYMCSHRQDQLCNCRKPNTKLFFDAKTRFNINMAASYMIGDRWSDVEAGNRAGVQPIFIDYGYRESKRRLGPCRVVEDLVAAVKVILG